MSIRHMCAFESICTLTNDLIEVQKDAMRGTMWASVLQYKAFAMDRHMVQGLIEAWNPDAKAFRLGRRDVPFLYFDMALLAGLPSTGRPVVFERHDHVGEVEQLLTVATEGRLQKERQRCGTGDTNMRIYRNYVSVPIDLCRQHNIVESVAMFRKLYALLVLSGLFFPRSTGRWHKI